MKGNFKKQIRDAQDVMIFFNLRSHFEVKRNLKIYSIHVNLINSWVDINE